MEGRHDRLKWELKNVLKQDIRISTLHSFLFGPLSLPPVGFPIMPSWIGLLAVCLLSSELFSKVPLATRQVWLVSTMFPVQLISRVAFVSTLCWRPMNKLYLGNILKGGRQRTTSVRRQVRHWCKWNSRLRSLLCKFEKAEVGKRTYVEAE